MNAKTHACRLAADEISRGTSDNHQVEGFAMLAFRSIDVAAARDTVADALQKNPIDENRKDGFSTNNKFNTDNN